MSAAPTQLVVPVPAGATTGPIQVATPSGSATGPVPFTVPVPPTITDFVPTSGPVDTLVLLTGTGFSHVAP